MILLYKRYEETLLQYYTCSWQVPYLSWKRVLNNASTLLPWYLHAFKLCFRALLLILDYKLNCAVKHHHGHLANALILEMLLMCVVS